MPKIADLKVDDQVSGVFTVQHAEFRHFADKPGRYLRIRFSDDSGIITGVCFDPDLIPFTIKTGMRISFKSAQVTSFKNELRVQFLPGAVIKMPEL